mmetsp:Transcript_50497/g.96459  ORF Transcript_50497/g.96459 Transcript_50497/m.96459 type:complete len:116 (+) Transcript_50497:22-369(+)
MYKPVGLGCGHCFCKLCVLRSSRVKVVNVPFQTLKNDSKCPMCRQEGVFSGAVELVSLNDLIRRNYTSEWLAQKESALLQMKLMVKSRRQFERRTKNSRTAVVENLYTRQNSVAN